jgi:hypothetical protein
MPEDTSIRPAFEGAAMGRDQRLDGQPDPKAVASAGIKTREAIAWIERQEPDDPAPRRTIDDEHVRRDANAVSEEERRMRMEKLRQEFRDRSRKGRRDFETSRAWRGNEYER